MVPKDQSQVPVAEQPGALRPNAIVLGDGIGDVTMVDGAAHPLDDARVLKVGFLNYDDPSKHIAK